MINKIKLLPHPKLISIKNDQNIFEIFCKIEQNSSNCFILESLGEYGNSNRYSIIGFDPEVTVKANKNKLTINDKTLYVNNPYEYLQNILPSKTSDTQFFTGGLVGYLGYDAVNYFEPQIKVKTHPDFDQFNFGVYTDGLVYDKLTGSLNYFYHYKNRIKTIQKLLKLKSKKQSLTVKFINDGLTEKQHSSIVSKIVKEIKSGNTFQTQLGFKRNYSFKGSHIEIYKKLRQVNPSPHMFYIKNKDKTLLGASPELLFKLKQKFMETFPLAGTIKRGVSEKEDQQLAKQMLQDPKEIAEHNMLVDLHRNDIGKVSKFGTVHVQKLKDIKKFSHVQHISSEISGIMDSRQNMFSAFKSNFPAGTLSGAPKVESIKIIDQFEKDPRGPYGGAIGFFGFNHNCQFCIPIRSLFISKNKGFVQASGGIVYDSKAKQEYQEIQNKLSALDQVLSSFKEAI